MKPLARGCSTAACTDGPEVFSFRDVKTKRVPIVQRLILFSKVLRLPPQRPSGSTVYSRQLLRCMLWQRLPVHVLTVSLSSTGTCTYESWLWYCSYVEAQYVPVRHFTTASVVCENAGIMASTLRGMAISEGCKSSARIIVAPSHNHFLDVPHHTFPNGIH